MNKKFIYIVIGHICILFCGCDKAFLEQKPTSEIVNPQTLEELEKLLQFEPIINHCTPGLSHMASDEYIFVGYAEWQTAQTITERNSYIWANDIYEGETEIRDWNFPYTTIFYCNNVLEGLRRIETNSLNAERKKILKGWALFVRGFAYYDLARHFAAPYDSHTAEHELGVPLKLTATVDEILQRGTLQQTYDQIQSDIKTAIPLLSSLVPNNRNQPSKPACYALLSRIYLTMRDYHKAELYADSTLALYDRLIDYNDLDTITDNPFTLHLRCFSMFVCFYGVSNTKLYWEEEFCLT